MTRDQLLALIATSFSHRPESVEGGFLFCHTPHVGELAYLGRVYDPVSTQRARAGFTEAQISENPYFGFVTEVANGIRLANISLYGVIEQVDRSGRGIGQPISIRYGNLYERPPGLSDADMVIGSIVGWSSCGNFVMGGGGTIRLIHPLDSANVAAEWPSLEAMLGAEFARLAQVHDPEGRKLATSTDMMHPNGRRWETEIEPGTTRH